LIEICRHCGGTVRIMPKALATLTEQALACIEDPVVIKKILAHLDRKDAPQETGLLPEGRAPPAGLFG
jgi:hypothetical protein